MYKKVLRPLWSYDIKNTEDWLTDMSLRGYKLEHINFKSRCFYFINADKKKLMYRFSYERNENTGISKSLLKDKWQVVTSFKRWSLLVNEPENIEIMPSRNSIIDRNDRLVRYTRMILLALTLLLIFGAMPGVVFIMLLGLPVQSSFGVVQLYIYLIYIGIWIFSLYSLIKINSSNKRMLQLEDLEPEVSSIGEKNIEDEIYLGKIPKAVVKVKLGGFYSPDKLELWLKEMSRKGLKLFKVSKNGNKFYFLKEGKTTRKYVVDFKKNVSSEYYEINKEAGWKLYFTSKERSYNWSIWAMDYTEDETEPVMYSDKEDIVEHARKVVISYSILYAPVIVMYLIVLGLTSYVNFVVRKQIDSTNILMFLVFTLAIAVYGIFLFRSVFYYLRVKKTY
ncbi:DUF2812 domain-containing protein [Clostridium sp. C8-1-8]|uniref:DUF2812 domain-containing protein n=1 Tax=Clostridium sp. C8-1-8 TaxID=2698831 RepID=UPI00136C906B|nr:DUF2812 domain-containing protein [Clostridium sp. C8-1-8]